MKHLHALLLAVGLAGSAFLPLDADANETNTLVLGDPTDSSVSGYSGWVANAGPPNSNHRGLFSIAWYEEQDDACEAVVRTHDIDEGYVHDVTDSFALSTCHSPGNGKVIELPGSDDYVYKVQVCTTDKDDTSQNELKGLRVWSRTVHHEDPVRLTTNSSFHESTHTNCKKWHQAASCPSGMIAARLKVHYSVDGNGWPRAFTGIQLVCREVLDAS